MSSISITPTPALKKLTDRSGAEVQPAGFFPPSVLLEGFNQWFSLLLTPTTVNSATDIVVDSGSGVSAIEGATWNLDGVGSVDGLH